MLIALFTNKNLHIDQNNQQLVKPRSKINI